MSSLVADITLEFQRCKALCDRALAGLSDAAFFHTPADAVNPVALIVKHLSGNLRSRWTDFLATDGEKPDRDRDGEFQLTDHDTRANLTAAWESAWAVLFATLEALTDADLDRTVTIRGEPHRVQQALIRGVNHASWHTGQILYLARLLHPDGPWLTIAPNASRQHRPGYLGK